MRRAASSRHVAESFSDRRNIVTRCNSDPCNRDRPIRIEESNIFFKGGNGWISTDFRARIFFKIRKKKFWDDDRRIDCWKCMQNIIPQNFTSIHRILRFFFKRYPSKNVIGVNVLWLSVEQSTALKIPLWREIRTRFTNPPVCKEACVPFPWFKRVPVIFIVLTGLWFLKRFLSTQKILSSRLIKPARRFPPREPNDRSAFR